MKLALLLPFLLAFPGPIFSAVSEYTRILGDKTGAVLVTITPVRESSKINISTICPARTFMTDSGSHVPTLWAKIKLKRLTPCANCSLSIASFPDQPMSCDTLFPLSRKKDLTIAVPDSFSFDWVPLLLLKPAQPPDYKATECNVGLWLFSSTQKDSFIASTLPSKGSIQTAFETGLGEKGIVVQRVNGTWRISCARQLNDPVVSIVDIHGKLAARLSSGHTALWNGRNQNGQFVAPGLYFVTIEDRKTKFTATNRFLVGF